jgi:hypothetical protein
MLMLRYQVTVGVARGLFYLAVGTSIKAAMSALYGVILSSRTLVCKAADFGLAFVGKDFN